MLIYYLSLLESGEERLKFEEIYNAHRGTMLHVAMTVLHGDLARAEDAVQSAFEAIIKNKEKYLSKSCSNLRGSCVIIVKNKCLDILRREKHFAFKEIDEFYDLESADTPVDEQIVRKSEYEILRKCMAVLSDRDRNILEMRFVLQMGVGEIAQDCGLTENNVSTIIQRAKIKVRNEMLNKQTPKP